MKKILFLILMVMGSSFALADSHCCYGDQSNGAKMQHGFVLSSNNQFASHLVAQGHHSYQASISGELIISDESELKKYKERRRLGEGKSYFVLQAQNFYLPGLAVGQILKGHIIESELGNYQPMNKIVLDANFLVNTVHMGVPNPFFK